MNPIKYTKEVVKEGKRVTLEDLTAGSLINQLRNVFGGK